MKIPEEWPTVGMIASGELAIKMGKDAFDIFNAMIAAAPTQPAQEDEPVYQHRAGWYGDDVWVDIGDLRYEALKANDVQVRKLYDRPADDKLRKDAERYRWLREQHWNEADFAVVCFPKKSVRLGADCPSLLRLDEAIDAAIRALPDTKGE